MVKRIQGSRMYLDLQTGGISRTLAVEGIREADHTTIMREELSQGMVVIDIGSNIGYYALLSASIVGPMGKVIAIEPDPRNVTLLQNSVRLNGYTNIVEIYQMAISDRSGTAWLSLSEASNLNQVANQKDSSNVPKSGNTNMLEVHVMSLDELMAEQTQIDFIRMDIEGHEVEALNGMISTLKRAKPPCKVMLEVHPYTYTPNHDFKIALQQVLDLGYKVKVLVSAGEAKPQQIVSRGYYPQREIRAGEFVHGIYQDVSAADAIELAESRPKCVRYLLLEKYLA